MAVGLVGRAEGRSVGVDFTVGLKVGLAVGAVGADEGRAAKSLMPCGGRLPFPPAPAAPAPGGEEVAGPGADAGVE